MKFTRINPVDSGTLGMYSNKMTDLIFAAKYKDGQKNQKTYGEIGHILQKQNSKFLKRRKAYLRALEKLNVPPPFLKMRNTLGIIDEYKPFQSVIVPLKYETHDLFGTGAITGTTNSHEVLERPQLLLLIEKWYEVQKKEKPKDDNLENFFFDEAFEFYILQNQLDKIQGGRIDEIADLRRGDIYYYSRGARRRSHQKTRRKKNRFYRVINKYNTQKGFLLQDLEYSDKGNITPEYRSLLKDENGKTLYEFYSRHFEFYLNSLVKLNLLKPDAFGKGANHLLMELHKYVLDHPLCPVKHLTDFEKFKLSLQRTYAYIGDLDKGLRIDIYRNIVDEKKGNISFEGGLLHILRHFRQRGITLSSDDKGGEGFDPENFFKFIASGFFHHSFSPKPENRNTYFANNVIYDLTGNPYRFFFYSNPHSPGLYFLTTIYREKK